MFRELKDDKYVTILARILLFLIDCIGIVWLVYWIMQVIFMTWDCGG